MNQGRHADLDRGAGHRLLQRQLQVVAQIGAAVHPRATAAAAAAEDVAEHIAEDVAEAGAAETARAARAGALIHAGMSELIVGRPLLRIGQDLVGLLGLLELRFGIRLSPGFRSG